jgi:glutathione-regulated potassium-efflux system protein KefB
MLSDYLLDLILLLMAAVVMVTLFQRLRLGSVSGFLVAGVVVGPSVLGLIDNRDEIGHFAAIGVVLLLFVIGVELNPSRLWRMRRLVFGLGSLQVILTGLVLGFLCYNWFDMPLRVAILVGPALALSSTAFVLQLLLEQGQMKSTYGRTSLAVLLFQDLAVVPLLALVPLLASPTLGIGTDIGLALLESLLILTLAVLLGRYFLHPVLHRVALAGNSEIFTASAVLLVLGSALLTEYLGLSMAMGAFVAGLLISDSSYKHLVMAEIQPFRGLLLGLFFMSMGMSLNLSLWLEDLLWPLVIVVGLIIIKVVVFYLGALFFGLKSRLNLAIALLLSQSGEFALVLFSLIQQNRLLSEDLFQQLLLVVLLSMLVTPVMAAMAQKLLAKNNHGSTLEGQRENHNGPILLVGFGRVGRGVAKILSMADKPFMAIDSNAATVEKGRADHHPVFYCDICTEELLDVVGSSKVRTMILTLNDASTTRTIVSLIRKIYPDVIIYVRGHGSSQCYELRKMGTAGVVSEHVEASLSLANMALAKEGLNEKTREAVLARYRHVSYEEIDDV